MAELWPKERMMKDFKAACCVYCYMGCEDMFSQTANSDSVKVIVPYRIRREKDRGKWVDNKIKLMPGYAFVYADDMAIIAEAIRGYKVHLLSYSDGDSILHGTDLEFARWVFNNGGVIGVSAAIHEQDKIRIVTGALKDSEGMIVQIDRRHMLAKVELKIGLRVWLSYDWLDRMERENGEADNADN